MTRKQFAAIADALYRSRPVSTTDAGRKFDAVAIQQHRLSCDQVAAALAEMNPRFDRDRFMAACGVEP